MASPPDLARRAGRVLLGGVLPGVVGGAVLLLAGVTAWPPWLGVTAVAAGSGVLALRRDRPAPPPRPAVAVAPEPVTAGLPVYSMQRPFRVVAAHGVPADAPYTVEVSTRTQAGLVIGPNEVVGPEGQWVPASGHNLTLTLTAPASGAVTVQRITAALLARAPFPGPVGVCLATRRMPDLVLSPDLLESLQRSVAAYRPLAAPDVAILLDAEPVDVARLNPVAAAPFEIAAGDTQTLVFAPVTSVQGWVRWRLSCEILSEGRVDTVYWDLSVTAATAMARYSADAAPVRTPVYQIYRDHWDPANDGREGPTGPEENRTFDIAGHTSADGTGFLTRPIRPGPEPESVEAARWRESGDSLAAGGRLAAAAQAYHQAAEAGSAQAAYLLGLLLQRGGDLHGARRWFTVAADRRFFLAFNNVGTMLVALGDSEQAELWFRRAMDEGDWTAAVNLAAVQARAGRLDEAEVILRVAAQVPVPRAAEMLAYVLVDQGRLDEAEQTLVHDATRPSRDHEDPDEPAYRR